MNGDVEEDVPRPRPLSAGIWTLFSWLRRTDRSSSSESVTSVGSDRTVASFDFLAPLNYKNSNTPLVLPQDPLTDTYKKRLQERNQRRQHDRDITLRRKYGLFREEGFGYDAFSLPSSRRLQKDNSFQQDRERRATSESIQRRSAYVPGKRRAPLPPIIVTSFTLPRNYKRKRPAPKPPSKLSEVNKENVQINKIIQMNSTTSDVNHLFHSKDISSVNKSEKHVKHGSKEIKLRTDKSFLKQIFDNKKRNSAIDISHIKLLPSISELDKQAAEIIEANKSLRASGGNTDDSASSMTSGSFTEETWICTTCFRKYKTVVKCCIYCVIKENSNRNKNDKNVPTIASNICTQTNENFIKSNRKSEINDKKKLREMLKEMKDSLPKRPKHYEKSGEENNGNKITTETPTLRIGSTIDEKMKISCDNTMSDIRYSQKKNESENLKKKAKEKFLTSQPSSSKQLPATPVDVEHKNKKSSLDDFSSSLCSSSNLNNIQNVFTSKIVLESKGSTDRGNNFLLTETKITRKFEETEDVSSCDDLGNISKIGASTTNDKIDKSIFNNKIGNVQNVNVTKLEKLPPTDLLPSLSHSTNPGEKIEFTEKPVNKNVTKTFASNNNLSTGQLIQRCGTGIENKNKVEIERIQLGNVFPPKEVIINQDKHTGKSNSSRNMDLHTPLKISSLLNPLYCPKYKPSNENIYDCNFAKTLATKNTIKEVNKNEPTTPNEKITTPNVTVSTLQCPSTSNPKLLHVGLQKSEASHIEPLKDKTCENLTPTVINEDPNCKTEKNTSSETVKTASTSSVKFLDHYDIRRNLIIQLEQAISKGDEQSAAEAAAKLAKLKLSCSVLSFSSQIVAESTPNNMNLLKNRLIKDENDSMIQKFGSNVKVESKVLPDKALNEQNHTHQSENKKPTSTALETNVLLDATASSSSNVIKDEIIPIEMWVEDKEAARGPIPLRISRKATMGVLKRHVETTLGLEIRLQRWIVGRTLCSDDNSRLVTLAGPELKAPFYLCLVESETNKDNSPHIKDDPHTQMKVEPSEINNAAASDVYTELMKLEQQALVPNTEEFECSVCIEQCAVGAGAVLRECIHTFCRECLADAVRHCEEPVVACPAIECRGALQEREIRALLPAEEYERWLARGLAAAESGTRNTFHCRTPDCKGWAFCEPGVRRFPCPVCKHTNCVPCQAVHEGETCERYQVKLREAVSAAESNQTDEGTQALLKSLISRGEALECPECSAIITKKWGCDWVKCSACKTEICWVTKGRRWGVGGKGDISGGCRCGVDGIRCHPSCGYCH